MSFPNVSKSKDSSLRCPDSAKHCTTCLVNAGDESGAQGARGQRLTIGILWALVEPQRELSSVKM